jgi:hypothetical protein
MPKQQLDRVMRDFYYGLDQIPPEEIGSGITREMERRWRMLQGLQVGGGGGRSTKRRRRQPAAGGGGERTGTVFGWVGTRPACR